MAKAIAYTFILVVALCVSAGEVTSTGSPTDFVRSSCGATRYPDLCFRCLASYAPAVRHSERQLARAALSVSVDRARSASTYVARVMAGAKSGNAKDAGAVKDCLENIADSVDQLRKSAEELDRLGRVGSADFTWHMSNVRTWCSSALTDENTCLDSLSEHCSSAVRSTVRPKVVEVAQITSNALALVNRVWSK
ncbi:21 kDa protein-like [Canna indica]|uniref:21 kDa protein-like n=1 Tax=Canna indica TaxID=4628 RepID=A0AAQ3JPF9_9LILI|nr:21 kDa protein-like [Canna indica]